LDTSSTFGRDGRHTPEHGHSLSDGGTGASDWPTVDRIEGDDHVLVVECLGCCGEGI
jgi:hypothetical protein